MKDAGLAIIFHRHIPEFHWQRIETGGTGLGIPDTNYCWHGQEGWIEFKRCKGWQIKIEPEQIAWLERRARAGGRVFVAVRRVEKPQTFWLIHGTQARFGLVAAQAIVKVEGNPASWPWPLIKLQLTS